MSISPLPALPASGASSNDSHLNRMLNPAGFCHWWGGSSPFSVPIGWNDRPVRNPSLTGSESLSPIPPEPLGGEPVPDSAGDGSRRMFR